MSRIQDGESIRGTIIRHARNAREPGSVPDTELAVLKSSAASSIRRGGWLDDQTNEPLIGWEIIGKATTGSGE